MTGIVLLAGQLGIAIGGFIGMAGALDWYHKGGKKDGKSSNKNLQPKP